MEGDRRKGGEHVHNYNTLITGEKWKEKGENRNGKEERRKEEGRYM